MIKVDEDTSLLKVVKSNSKASFEGWHHFLNFFLYSLIWIVLSEEQFADLFALIKL